MHITERLRVVRENWRHDCYDGRGEHCNTCAEIEQHLDAIQAEVEELLARIPAQPDATPAHITLTAS